MGNLGQNTSNEEDGEDGEGGEGLSGGEELFLKISVAKNNFLTDGCRKKRILTLPGPSALSYPRAAL